MRAIRCIALFALFFGIVSATTGATVAAGGTTYYLDDLGGSDSNLGTSPSTAWKSLARANASVLQSGDRLLLRRGGVWQGSLKLAESGTALAAITVDAYGSGPFPLIHGAGTCVSIPGSYVAVQSLHADDCSWAGFQIAGSNDRLDGIVSSNNVAGVQVKGGATNNAVLHSNLYDNNKMGTLTPTPTDDDSGAFGVLLNGDRTEVAYNRISGSDAFSYDYGRDGSAVEVYGGQWNNVHDNLSIDNQAFAELGNFRSSDNTVAQNVVVSSLATSMFLITRGAKSHWGPVYGTRAIANTVLLTGASSQGFSCGDGCSSKVLTMRDNIIQAVAVVGYADARFDEAYDLFWGGDRRFKVDRTSRIGDPRFVDPGAADLHLQASSPAVDAAVDVGLTVDFDGLPIPIDGNGDGRAAPDIGAYEYAQ